MRWGQRRPNQSRQVLDEACRTLGGRHSAATSAGPSSGCSDHRRNAMGMARRLGAPLASESSGQRLANSVQQDESHSCFERDGIGSHALAEVRSIVPLVGFAGSRMSPPASRHSRHRGSELLNMRCPVRALESESRSMNQGSGSAQQRIALWSKQALCMTKVSCATATAP